MEFFEKINHLDLEQTLFCGQAFRFRRLSAHEFDGAADNKYIFLRQERDGVSFRTDDNERDFWRNYFALDTDYAAIIEILSQNETFKKACAYAPGIRVLRQQPFETLISFIISQNNNISRITGIVNRLCDAFGEAIPGCDLKAFPTAKRIAALSEEDLTPLRAGFRARYILDGARKVADGTVDLEKLRDFSTDEARENLMKIVGVGEKVADCVLLFAYGKSGAVPKDVWIKRALSRYFPDGFPECAAGYEGIAQQYLFNYIRNGTNN